jgi:hypothetical protein
MWRALLPLVAVDSTSYPATLLSGALGVLRVLCVLRGVGGKPPGLALPGACLCEGFMWRASIVSVPFCSWQDCVHLCTSHSTVFALLTTS